MRTMTTDVAIIGGGINGCGIAYYLAKKGIDVVVLEAKFVAAMGSGRGVGFVRSQCRDLAELPFSIESNKMYPTLNDELDYDTEYRRSGVLYIVISEELVPYLHGMYKRQEDFGYKASRLLTPEEVYEIIPQTPREAVLGMYTPTDGQTNSWRTTKAYFLGARRLGVKALTHTPVKRINVLRGRVVSVDAGDLTVKANWVLNVTGVHAKEISKTIGIDLPIESLVFEVIVTEPLPPFLTPAFSCIDEKAAYRQTADGNVLFASSMLNELTYDMTVTREKFKERVKKMMFVFPKQLRNVSVIRSYAGLYDITPDLIPIIDSFENPRGYFVAAGFSGHGVAIAPAVCKEVAEWISTGKPSMDFGKFRYSRFSEKDISEWGKEKRLYGYQSYQSYKTKKSE